MLSPENQQNRIDILFYYSMQEYSGVTACFEHSNVFKVNLLESRDTQLRAPLNLQQKHGLQSSLSSMITAPRPLRSNYELFNHNNFNICYWSSSDESAIVIFRHYLVRNLTLIPCYPSKPLWASMPQSTVDTAHL